MTDTLQGDVNSNGYFQPLKRLRDNLILAGSKRMSQRTAAWHETVYNPKCNPYRGL